MARRYGPRALPKVLNADVAGGRGRCPRARRVVLDPAGPHMLPGYHAGGRGRGTRRRVLGSGPPGPGAGRVPRTCAGPMSRGRFIGTSCVTLLSLTVLALTCCPVIAG